MRGVPACAGAGRLSLSPTLLRIGARGAPGNRCCVRHARHGGMDPPGGSPQPCLPKRRPSLFHRGAAAQARRAEQSRLGVAADLREHPVDAGRKEPRRPSAVVGTAIRAPKRHVVPHLPLNAGTDHPACLQMVGAGPLFIAYTFSTGVAATGYDHPLRKAGCAAHQKSGRKYMAGFDDVGQFVRSITVNPVRSRHGRRANR